MPTRTERLTNPCSSTKRSSTVEDLRGQLAEKATEAHAREDELCKALDQMNDELLNVTSQRDEAETRVELTWLYGGRLRVSTRSWIGTIRVAGRRINIVPKLVGSTLGVPQMLEFAGGLPDAAFACVGGGSNAIGLFHPLIADADKVVTV